MWAVKVLILVDFNDLRLTQIQIRVCILICLQIRPCSFFTSIVIAKFAVSHLTLDLVENALCGGVVVPPIFGKPAGTGILVVAGVVIVVGLVVVGDALQQLRLFASSGHKLVSLLAPFQRGVQQNAVVDLRRSVFLLLRQGQLGIRCQIKVVDVVVAIVNLMLFTVDLYIVVQGGIPISINLSALRNTLHHLVIGIPVVRCCSQKRCGAIVVFAGVLGGGFQLLQVRDQFGIGHGIIVDHMSHYLDNLFPFRFAGIDQGLDHAVVIVLDDKLLTVILSFFTGFIQLRVERIFGFFLRAAGACNHVRLRLLDFHSQLLCPIIVACRVGLAIFSRVGNGLIIIQADKVASKLSLDLFLAQLPGGNGDDGHGAIVFGLFVGFDIARFVFQRHPGIGRSVGFKISKVKRSIATVLAAAPLLLF